ncbi:hypothetical protein BH20ACT10_BH20ACT10_14520 [soil metagenome]
MGVSLLGVGWAWLGYGVVSVIRCSLSESSVRTSKTSSHTPALAHRVNRMWLVFQLPYLSGMWHQYAPLLSTHNTPFTKVRLSAAVLPRSPSLPGSRSSILCH